MDNIVALPSQDNIDSAESESGDQTSLQITDIVSDDSTGYIVHTVRKEDTLLGLAFMYGVKVQAIKKENKLFSDQIFARKTLVIPLTQQDVEKLIEQRKKQTQDKQMERNAMVARFTEATKSNEKIAKSFLKRMKFDYSKAIQQYELELKRQQQQPKRAQLTSSLNSNSRTSANTSLPPKKETSPILEGARYYSYNSSRPMELTPARKINSRQEAKLEGGVKQFFDL